MLRADPAGLRGELTDEARVSNNEIALKYREEMATISHIPGYLGISHAGPAPARA